MAYNTWAQLLQTTRQQFTVYGGRWTFCSQDLSFLGTSFPGTFNPKTFHSQERLFPTTTIPEIFRSRGACIFLSLLFFILINILRHASVALGNEHSEERKVLVMNVLHRDFSFLGTKGLGKRKSVIHLPQSVIDSTLNILNSFTNGLDNMRKTRMCFLWTSRSAGPTGLTCFRGSVWEPQETAGDTAGRAVSRRHRQKSCQLAAAAAGKKCILPMSVNSTDRQFNITMLHFCIISTYKPVRNTPSTNCRVLLLTF